jgi:hypothetical protein
MNHKHYLYENWSFPGSENLNSDVLSYNTV